MRIVTVFLLCQFGLAASAQQKGSDSLNYAPGYPKYRIAQELQLESFPLPRFKPGVVMHRNFSWFDFVYMAYDYTKTQQSKTGTWVYPGFRSEANADAAITMNAEMVQHWNYCFNIPTPTYYYRDFAKPKTFAGKLVAYADQHPTMPVCTYTFWGGIRPREAGYAPLQPFIRSGTNISPCRNDSTFPQIRKDGLTQQLYLRALTDALPHRDSLCKIEMLNENGEVFGPAWTPNAEGYRDDTLIACIQHDRRTARRDRAHWQYQVFHAYAGRFANTTELPGLLQTEFSFYQVAAFLPEYYGEYTEMRHINGTLRGQHYSTPDFYPGDAQHSIFDRYAAYHGIDCIAEGRKDEIACGDPYFSPFVCAGWFADSLNIRPAPWLASLKAMAMLGAEFYYPAFFNTKNPAVVQPIDPRSYIYQVAMPVYAQAVTSRFASVFFHSKEFTYDRMDDLLAITRKDTTHNVYAIHASWFPDDATEKKESESGKVQVGDERLKINFRRQGSTYIYDKTNPGAPVFYQLDGWHENAHPWYWSKNFLFEAELCDDSLPPPLRTERPAKADANDYTSFTTYAVFTDNRAQKTGMHFTFEPRSSDSSGYYLWIKARRSASAKGAAGARLTLDGKTYEVKDISAAVFQWYAVKLKDKAVQVHPAPGSSHTLGLFPSGDALELDAVLLSVSPLPPR